MSSAFKSKSGVAILAVLAGLPEINDADKQTALPRQSDCFGESSGKFAAIEFAKTGEVLATSNECDAEYKAKKGRARQVPAETCGPSRLETRRRHVQAPGCYRKARGTVDARVKDLLALTALT